jgi:hypothetical protein
MLHCAGGRALYILLACSYVTVRISFGCGCKIFISTQFIIVLISLHRYLISDYTFCSSQPKKRFWFENLS